VWNETFSWNGVLFDLLQDGLVVSLFDRDMASRPQSPHISPHLPPSTHTKASPDDCLGM